MITIQWYSSKRNRWFNNTFESKNQAFTNRIRFLIENKVEFKVIEEES